MCVEEKKYEFVRKVLMARQDRISPLPPLPPPVIQISFLEEAPSV